MTKYLIIGLLVALAITGAFAKFQYDRANENAERATKSEANREADRITFDAAKKDLEQSILTIEKERARDQVKIDALGEKSAQIAGERDDAKAKLDSYRTRLSEAAQAKPGLVGNLATRATGRLFDAFRGATDPNRKADGGGEAVPPAPAERGAAAGPDRDRGGDAGRRAPVE